MGLATDEDLALSGISEISVSVRELLGKNPFSWDSPRDSARLLRRFKNLSLFGPEGLKLAVERIREIYDTDPKNVSLRQHLEILANMGIRLDEEDLPGFMKLFCENCFVEGKGVILGVNTLPNLWSGDDPDTRTYNFIRAELNMLDVGVNPFTGALAKTFVDKLATYADDEIKAIEIMEQMSVFSNGST
ncbi:MAG: hypothetical protein AABZ14_09300 [Candidatus Margulisiibacteriota bacterium]